MWSKPVKAVALASTLFTLSACGGDEDYTYSAQAPASERALAVGVGENDNFQEGVISATTNSLSAGGTSQLAFNVVDRNQGNALMTGEPEEITISSRCLSASTPMAIIDTATTFNTSSGQVSFKYLAEGCSGTDTVVATLPAGQAASVNLNIDASKAVAIQSNPPEPSSISPDGNASTSRPGVSRVNFTVVDNKGNPVSGREVSFRLSYPSDLNTGGGAPTLENESFSDTTSTAGIATAIVKAGTQNTVVRVIATILEDGASIETTSPPIAINTSVPHQQGFTFAPDRYAPNAWAHEGVTVDITVYASDLSGVKLRSGTVVSFTTTGGAVNGDCELDDEGSCTVTWRSQNPRPDNARPVVLARTVGDESFADTLRSNGTFDEGEVLVGGGEGERGEAFYDLNPNGLRDASEVFFDDNGNNSYDGPNGVYEGSACPEKNLEYCEKNPVTVWDSFPLIMASDVGIKVNLEADPDVNGRYCAKASGAAGSAQRTPMPTGTTFAFSVDTQSTGKVTSAGTTATVGSEYTTADSSTYCVNAIGPGTLRVVVTPPAPFNGTGSEASLAL